MMTDLVYIPARGGSKRLPNKNIKMMAGKPLIVWTIEAALNACPDADVVVSTDCTEIAKIAKSAGAIVPFLRPELLSTDHSSSYDGLIYTLDKLKEEGKTYEKVMFLQPTSPLRLPQHITESFSLLNEKGVKSVISVTEVEHPIEWTMTLPNSKRMDDFIQHSESALKTRSQDFEPRYRVNGAIFCSDINALIKEKSFYMKSGTQAYVMERRYAIDIDNLADFEYAEFLMSKSTK